MVTNIRLFRKICILQEELARMAIVEHVTVHAVLASGRCVSKAVAPVQMG